MGVPKFYRWISERFPCLSETVKDHQIPEFDNLYLDMNGIVHVCSHPDDGNPHFRITEEKIFADIFHYLEVLFRMIKPRKVFFMAIDGVAPRAKMNQQRGRRFRSAKDAELLEKKAKSRGETLPSEARFDSNCITPGTEFMVRLHKQLQYFVVSKQSRDELWKGVTIYLSGHETPGEGEHKIMDFIRSEKAKPDYDPNTRHCLYGLDADLIMLGLTTHEPHFALLREEVRFGKQAQKRSNTVEETTFHLLHISLLREYLDMEFASLKDELAITRSFQYDLERVIDDWVLMGFLVGNDFIPHLPHLHIAQDALPTIWSTYKQILPSLGGYINDKGDINMYRLERLLTALSQWELDRFSEGMADMKWMDSKRSATKSWKSKKASQGENEMREAVDEMDNFEDEFAVDEDMPTPYMPEREESEDSIGYEFRKHKSAYYFEKMDLQATPEVLAQQAKDYVTGLQWISHYYYTGVPSWGWFFPHHYAPYMSDLHSFADLEVVFEQGTPFMPFQQLMAVLPAASKDLLPEAYRPLMLSSNSPIIDFYPQEFETDLNGKRQDWEAVVLIPFINEKQLIEAMQSVEHKLTSSEIARNIHGPCLIYRHARESQGVYKSTLPNFPNIGQNHTMVTKKMWDEFAVSIEQLKAGLCANVRPTLYYPGFPTFAHLKYMSYLQKMGVTIFQQPSRGENRMVKILDEMDVDHIDLVELGKQYLGKSIWVNWPHLVEARVFSLETDTEKVVLGGKDNSEVVKSETKSTSQNIFLSKTAAMAENMEKRRGVDITDTFVLVHAQPLTGRKYVYLNDGRVTVGKEWQTQAVPYALQACVSNECMLKLRVDQFGVEEAGSVQYFSLSDVFPEDSSVYMLANPHYGCEGQVIDHPKGRVKVKVSRLFEPDLQSVYEQKAQSRYMRAFEVAQHLGVSSHFISRITGTLYLFNGGDSINVGLNLKNNKKNEECPGFTRKEEADWLYSQHTEDIIYSYLEKFPDFCKYLHENLNKDKLMTDNIFPENRDERCRQVTDFLKSLPTHSCPRARCGNEFVEASVVASIERQVERSKKRTSEGKEYVITVKPAHIYKQYSLTSTMIPDPEAEYRLLDRVVNVRLGYTVPYGLRGTVIGLIKDHDPRDEMIEVVFDSEFACGLTTRCTPGKGYRCPPHALINISHGARLANQKGYSGHVSKTAANATPNGQGKRYSATMNGKGQGHKNKSSNASDEASQQSPVTVLRRAEPSKTKQTGQYAGQPTIRTLPSARKVSPQSASPAHGKGVPLGSAKNRPAQHNMRQSNGNVQSSPLMTPNDFVTPKTAKTDGRMKSQERADHNDVWAKLKATKNESKQSKNATQLSNSCQSLSQAAAALKNIHPPPSQPPRVGKPLKNEEMQELSAGNQTPQTTPKAGDKIDVQTLLSGGDRPKSNTKGKGDGRQVQRELYDTSKQKSKGAQKGSQKQKMKEGKPAADAGSHSSQPPAASDQESGGFNFSSLVSALENINEKPEMTDNVQPASDKVKVEPEQPVIMEQPRHPHVNPASTTPSQPPPGAPLIAQAPMQQYGMPMQHPQFQGQRPSSSEAARAAGVPLMAANARPAVPMTPKDMLHQLAVSMRWPPPTYYLNPVPHPLFQVTVVVGSMRCVGMLTRDQMLAVNSAANVALTQIQSFVQQQQQQRMQQVAAGPRETAPVMMNHLMHHQVQPAAMYNTSANSNQSSFVPMQVTRKKANNDQPGKEAPTAAFAAEVKVEAKTPNANPESAAVGKVESKHDRNASYKKSASKSNKKTKCRLAANFGGSPRT